MKRLPVYVPVGPLADQIDRGSGVVGTPDDNRVMIDYEGNRYGAVNIRTYADRVHHAYGRHTARYPTIARTYTAAANLVQIGWWEPELREVDLNDEVTLAEWLGREDVPEDELRCTRP